MAERWFKIDGEAGGDRTFEEQVTALRPALDEVKGKTVLDLGCAEGLIACEFAKAGAQFVVGVELQEANVEVARKHCLYSNVSFECANLDDVVTNEPRQFDIVLALGVLHKLKLIEAGLWYAARSAKEMLLLRGGKALRHGFIYPKAAMVFPCNAHMLLEAEGFRLEKSVVGPPPYLEVVEYWRRQ